MSVKERIILFIKTKKITSTEFCNTIGVSKAFVSSMRHSLQPDKIKSIALHYPELNISWLLTGDGEMIKTSYAPRKFLEKFLPEELLEPVKECSDCKQKDILIEELRNRIKDKDQLIELLMKNQGSINKSAI